MFFHFIIFSDFQIFRFSDSQILDLRSQMIGHRVQNLDIQILETR